MTLSAIAAVAKNGVIGVENRLPWHLPADLKQFRRLTMGHAVVMGRRTYESIGHPLEGRINVVLSRNSNFSLPGCLVKNSFSSAVEAIKREGAHHLFVIGGERLYRETLPFLDQIYLTRIHASFPGEHHFPLLGDEWDIVWQENHHHDPQNPFDFSFLLLRRKTLQA